MKLPILLLAALSAGSLASCDANNDADFQSEKGDPVGAKALAEDLDLFESQILLQDAAFTDKERDEALKGVAELRRRLDSISDAQFALELGRLAAIADNGHTGLLWVPAALRFPRLEVSFFDGSNGVFIAAAKGEYGELVGKKVEMIAGKSVAQWRQAFAEFASGEEGFREQSFLVFLESPALLEAAGGKVSDGSVTLEFADGAASSVSSSEWQDPPEGVWAFFPQAREIQLTSTWAAARRPVYLEEPEAAMRLVPLQGGNVAYLQFRSNVDFSGNTDLTQESQKALDELRSWKPDAIIVDQRFNFGGDLNTTRDLMEEIPNLVKSGGKLFAIVSGRTFSAGISSVAYLKQAAGDDLEIVGPPVGDNLEFFAEGGDPVELKNSGLLFFTARERHNYKTGCPETDCHASIRDHPIAIESLAPDLSPPFTYDDFVNGKDPYLDTIMARL